MKRNRALIIGIIALVVVTSVVTFAVSAFLFTGFGLMKPNYSLSFDPKVVNYENVKKFNQVRSILKKYYYEDVDENTLLEGAVSGMADSLKDPYTVYFNKDQMQKLLEMPKKSEETYEGVGMTVVTDNNGLVTVIEPFEGSPAQKAGIQQGDKIIKVNDEDVTMLRDEGAVVKLLKGPANTSVKITVYRPSEGRSIDFDVKRQKINYVFNIKSSMLTDQIGYIRINSFMDDNIETLFNQHLDSLVKKGMKGLVIDVRDNPGGYYRAVVHIADRLLPEGLIVYTQDKYKNVEKQESKPGELGMPIVLLVNGNSASASEILAGALKDNKKGILVGTKTFGKGLVQDVIPLDDGSGIKVTISRYFTPSGVCIQGIGIQPDVEVKLDEKYNNTPVSQVSRKDDLQLAKALEIMKEQLKQQ